MNFMEMSRLLNRHLFVLILSLLIPNSLICQDQKSDSLYVAEKLEIIRPLLFQNSDSARKLSMDVYQYSIKRNFAWGESQAWILLAATYHRQGQYDTAIVLCQRTIDMFSNVKDSIHLGSAYLTQGMCYVSTGNYEKGAEKTLNSLRIFEKLEAQGVMAARKFLPRSYNILGQVYYYQNDFETTEKYFLSYLELATRYQDTLLIGSANTNLGAVYFELGQYDRALEHDRRAAEIQNALGNKHGYGNALQNIAIGLKYRDEFEEAILYYNKALKIYQEIPNLKSQTEVYYNLGELYIETGDYRLSETNYQKAIDLSLEAKNPEVQKWSIRGLSKVEAARGNHIGALELFKEYHTLSDSLVNETNRNKISELQVAYDTERKEQEIALLNTKNELQASTIRQSNILLVAAVVLIILILLIAFFIFRQKELKTKAKLDREKASLKEEQIEAVIISQEKERRRFAMDLHDDFGQLISALKLNISKQDGNEATAKSKKILDNMYISLKNIAFNLMPHTLHEKGLEQAIDELKEQINSSGLIKMHFQSFGITDKIADNQKIAIYRIVQELVSNIVKYANASKINVSITDLGDRFSLMVEDDGNGFSVSDFKNSSGNGWKNIRSRLDLMNGGIEFDTTPGRRNSSVIIEIPYEKLSSKVEVA